MRMKLALLALSTLVVASVAEAAPAKVTYMKGRADYLASAKKHTKDGQIAKNAPWKKLTKGKKLAEGAAVRTQAGARLEIQLGDGSRLRLDQNTTMSLDRAHVSKKNKNRAVSVRVFVGQLWAKVAKRVAGESSFEVETKNAVAGVRGTSFTVVANTDLSSLVKVYTGTVGVRKSGRGYAGRVRQEVPGPTRIDKKQWEEVIATAMKQVQVSALGEIAPAEGFRDAGEQAEWAMWNQERDQAIQ